MSKLIINPYFNISTPSSTCNNNLTNIGIINNSSMQLDDCTLTGDQLRTIKDHMPLYQFMISELLSKKQIKKMVAYIPSTIQFLESPSTKLQVDAVTKDPKVFELIESPAYQTIKIAVKTYPENVKYVRDPSDEIQMLAGINQISLISNPCMELQLKYIESNRNAIFKLKSTYDEVIKLHEMLWVL